MLINNKLSNYKFSTIGRLYPPKCVSHKVRVRCVDMKQHASCFVDPLHISLQPSNIKMSNIEPEENCAPLISPRVIPSLPSVTERYFQYKIYLSPKNGSINNNDLLLLVHSNR